jgi:hypothetical protein
MCSCCLLGFLKQYQRGSYEKYEINRLTFTLKKEVEVKGNSSECIAIHLSKLATKTSSYHVHQIAYFESQKQPNM